VAFEPFQHNADLLRIENFDFRRVHLWRRHDRGDIAREGFQLHGPLQRGMQHPVRMTDRAG